MIVRLTLKDCEIEISRATFSDSDFEFHFYKEDFRFSLIPILTLTPKNSLTGLCFSWFIIKLSTGVWKLGF